MKSFSLKALLLLTTFALVGAQGAYALTDQEAMEDGMMPIEEYAMAEMKAVLTPGLNSEGVAEAVRNHRLVIAVNKAAKGKGAQTLTMYENGVEILKEKISTGREKEEKAKSGRTYFSTTPKGFFRPTKIYRDYLSYTWNAPMPNAVFFIGGIALHATTKSHYKELGTRASGGCVRMIHESSLLLREKVMDTGLGSSPGQFKVVNEAKGRNRITNNSVSVNQLNRNTGDLLASKVSSWDTVIIVYEE
ncbi:L,D-transpeptidase [Peredibacter sp. HCB2-198]|uniref:L,D-transpeptidase n=1 Tax=Peredibacter sp. HCB2-198 TaxID=3383025 RepID=UPI0038B4BAEE